MSEWISVKDRLPDEEVLAVNKYKNYAIGYIAPDEEVGTGYLCESNYEYLYNVTHWMPLPEPPEESPIKKTD